MQRPRFLPDNFSLMIIAMVVLASFLPIAGHAAVVFNQLTNAAIALLFFLHGVKLSREAVIQGLTHWRLHLFIFASTFILFPILGLILKPVIEPLIGNSLYLGLLYLCMLPSTVQSSIAFTSIAKGNVPAALCSASASNLLGMFITPFLVSIFIAQSAHASASSGDAVLNIVLLLLVPFVLGQLLRVKIFPLLKQHTGAVKMVDQGSILMVVYAAFSEAVSEGIWHQVSFETLMILVVLSCSLLAVVMLLLNVLSKACGFKREDRITILFCGSKKTLASGVPMAKIIFASQPIGLIILLLMLFHQIQLIVCGILASKFAAQHSNTDESA
ncbi:bile acid:sodium symporter family protein [Acinetobacter sp. MD2(2019)]|uniref:bile acid:sodium symporter family protein n=1 Tax=Acinetobacter sp. MD2(2019) TaxID=2605273 RepID=UPI002D1F7E5B|nr:bile acid:sodium symporter family protein [Acinetobacter sp. MD2(2019)]MEB3753685.1 bile acid:sodium symporter [Acinetobacter sp. MD2(2019)]